MMFFLSIIFSISFCVHASKMNIYADHWKDLHPDKLKSLYPSQDKSFLNQLNLFFELIYLVTSKYTMLGGDFEEEGAKRGIFLKGNSDLPIIWHQERMELSKFHDESLDVTLIKPWKKLTVKESAEKSVLVGITKESKSKIIFDFKSLKHTGNKECYLQTYKCTKDTPVFDCDLKLICFDPKETKRLSSSFHRKLSASIKDLKEGNDAIDVKKVFGRANFGFQEWSIFLPTLDISLREFAGTEARKHADSPAIRAIIFWQIYASLWRRILPPSFKLLCPQELLELVAKSDDTFQMTNVKAWAYDRLPSIHKHFMTKTTEGFTRKMFNSNINNDKLVFYLGPFVPSAMTWPTRQSRTKHAMPVEWLSALILSPISSLDKVNINPDLKIKKLLHNINVTNQTLQQWERQFVLLHRNLPKHTFKPLEKTCDTYVSRFPIHEFHYLVINNDNEQEDKNQFYGYAEHSVAMPIALISPKKRLEEEYGLPQPGIGMIIMIDKSYYRLMVKSDHPYIPSGIPLFAYHQVQ